LYQSSVICVPKRETASHLSHFRIFGLVTAGRDRQFYRFEITALTEHLNFYLACCKRLKNQRILARSNPAKIQLTVFDEEIQSEILQAEVLDRLSQQYAAVEFSYVLARTRVITPGEIESCCD